MIDDGTSRRDVLKATGGLLALGGTTSLAGCASVLGGGGGDFTKWAWEPGELIDRDHYAIAVEYPKKVAKHEDSFENDYYDDLEERKERTLDPIGLDYDEVDTFINFPWHGIDVVKGGYKKKEVVADLEDDDWDDDTDHEGYTIMLNPDESRAIALDGTHAIRTRPFPDMDPVESAEFVIDTRKGDEDRYVDESDAMKALTDKVPSADNVWFSTNEPVEDTLEEQGEFENEVGVAYGLDYSGETTNLYIGLAFEENDDIDKDDIEDWIQANDGSDETFDDVDDVKVNVKGNVVVLKGKIDTDDLGD